MHTNETNTERTGRAGAITGAIIGAVVVVGFGAFLALSDWDVQEPGEVQLPQFDVDSGSVELPDVDVDVDVEPGELELPSAEMTREGALELPKVSVETPRVEVGTETVEVEVPTVGIEIPDEEERSDEADQPFEKGSRADSD